MIGAATIFGADTKSDLTNRDSTLSSVDKRNYERKFGFVGGSWCCAPMDEMKKGAPRSAHFRLSTA